jgi:hypothetical protein
MAPAFPSDLRLPRPSSPPSPMRWTSREGRGIKGLGQVIGQLPLSGMMPWLWALGLPLRQPDHRLGCKSSEFMHVSAE